MHRLVGLYIEDEPKNIILMKGRFSLFSGIDLIGIENYPAKPDDFYEFVIKNNVDFLIVDHELDKLSVDYKGIDVLREIRKHDSNIYAVLLTNYPLDDYKGELGEYDFQLNKADLKDTGKMEELVTKIKRACTLRMDNDILASMDHKQREASELLALLQEMKNTTEKG